MCEDCDYQGRFGRSLIRREATINPDTSEAHTAGDVVSNVLTFADLTFVDGCSVEIVKVELFETAVSGVPQEGAMVLVLCQEEPAPVTQNDPYTAPATPLNVVATIAIETGDWLTLDAANSVAVVRLTDPIAGLNGGQNLFGVLVTQSAPTYSGGAVLGIRITWQPN